jgi:hypothetical protein
MLISSIASGQVLHESAKLLPSDGAAEDIFGGFVSVSGDVAVVGAHQDDDNGTDSGSAYVFRWNGSSWVQQQKLLPSDGAAVDLFGGAVSVSGDVAVVSADLHDHNGYDSGSAYVFRWNPGAPGSWVQEQELLPSDGTAGDYFGRSVYVSGDVALVGAIYNDRPYPGSAYVFRYDASESICGQKWCEQQKLLASDGAAYDLFGFVVSVAGDVAVVGARWNDDKGTDSGSAYVFRWNGSSWVEEQKLLASDGAADDWFGQSVSVSGNVAVVGAEGDDDNGTDSGSAYVFRWNPGAPGSWVQEQKLLPSDGTAGDRFGSHVSVFGDVIVVGAILDDHNGIESGSAYVFRWNGSSWMQEQKLLPSDGAVGDWFGSVSVSGDVAVVGAALDDDNGSRSGSAYVFDLTASPIPAVSAWGAAALTLLLLTAGTLVCRRRAEAARRFC